MTRDLTPLQRIEILGLEFFDTHPAEINLVEQFRTKLNAILGWHYYLDLAWILRSLKGLPEGSLVLDAGAGSGMLQFMLSDLRYNVISADFLERNFPADYLKLYGHKISFLKNPKQTFDNRYTQHIQSSYDANQCRYGAHLKGWLRHVYYMNLLHRLIHKKTCFLQTKYDKPLSKSDFSSKRGTILLYKCDLKDMTLLPNGFFDAVVSVSALEHNNYTDVEKCIEEILRVTKPSGKLMITTSTSCSEDFFHEPSKGWCYSEPTLRKLFSLPASVPSNYSKMDLIFKDIMTEGNQLHQRLAPAYFKSGDNGMPWGKWNPQYLPVGILKIKSS